MWNMTTGDILHV